MRKLHEAVVSCYMNFVAIWFMLAVTLSLGLRIDPWTKDFGWEEKLFCIGLSVSTVLSQTTRYKGLQHWEATKLQPYQFINPVVQLVADIIIFDAKFSSMQMVGILIVVSVYVVELIYNCFFAASKPKVESQETKKEEAQSKV